MTEEKKDSKKDKSYGLIDMFQERPLFSFIVLFFVFYIIWYLNGGVERTELKYGVDGWVLVFKHLFHF